MAQKSDKNKFLFAFGVFGGAGIMFAFAVIAGSYLGLYLDKTYHTKPFLLLLCVTLGFAAGLFNLLRLLEYYKNNKD